MIRPLLLILNTKERDILDLLEYSYIELLFS